MDIHIFLLCFNESALLPHAVRHYKKYLPSCKIIIYDNESTDNSVEIAKSLGCHIISWGSDNCINDFKYKDIKNNCWKYLKRGWVIMADMDEFLCVTEEELLKEMRMGTSVLAIRGYDMVGESETIDLSDIDLQKIQKYNVNPWESKNLCFLREKIEEMDYGYGAHGCKPTGDVKYSPTIYINKHMKILGLNYLISNYTKLYERAGFMRKYGGALHYTSDIEVIKKKYYDALHNV